jgi:glutamate-1-semialdehyde 2,1-aminomutase
MLKTEKNKVLTEKFNKLYPGGHTNLRVSLEATQHRVFVVRAEGSHLWDVDGNEYIDYQGGLGPNILGHRHPEYVQALKDLLDTSSVCLGSGLFHTPDDIEVAERLVKHVPCAERVKFCLSGSEAVQLAIRLARGYTGRPYFIRFGGHYHGWFDNIIGGLVDPNPKGKPFPFYDPNADPMTDPYFTKGRAPSTDQESFLLPWNDLDILEDTLKKYGDEVAIIHFEALVVNHGALEPRPGFLEKVRELCTKYGIVMSIDEVITGFRMGISGAQGHYGVTPDIATFGKAMAGGLPFSAVVGKAEIMEQLRARTVLGPGTFNGNPLGMRAVLATLKILEKDNGAAYDKMEKLQLRLTDGLSALAKKHGIPLRIQGARGLFYTAFGLDSDKVLYTEEDLAGIDFQKVLQFWAALKQEGISAVIGGRWYMSIAHTEEDVTRTLEAADKVMATL